MPGNWQEEGPEKERGPRPVRDHERVWLSPHLPCLWMLLRHSQQQLLGCHGHHDQVGGHDDREWQTDWWPFRAYFINIFNDFFPCVISPCVFIFNAPVIRRGMEQKVRNVVVDIYDISYCLWWNNTPLNPRWRAGWSCWGWAQEGSWGRGGWGTTTTWWTAGTPAPALAPV